MEQDDAAKLKLCLAGVSIEWSEESFSPNMKLSFVVTLVCNQLLHFSLWLMCNKYSVSSSSIVTHWKWLAMWPRTSHLLMCFREMFAIYLYMESNHCIYLRGIQTFVFSVGLFRFGTVSGVMEVRMTWRENKVKQVLMTGGLTSTGAAMATHTHTHAEVHVLGARYIYFQHVCACVSKVAVYSLCMFTNIQSSVGL